MRYDFRVVEKKWREYWKRTRYFETGKDRKKKKFYCLDMFPYPSGSGLHVGHWKGYVFSDLYARIKLLEGYNVLHPIGFDAFGLPAENYAIQQGVHPKISTEKNIENFKCQLDMIGAVYDWDKEVNTSDPEYYKWTQWIFLKMYKAGLAYQDFKPINWCNQCMTGLANEEVVGGSCERCGSEVGKREIRQWVLRITKYADKLLSGLDRLDWPERVKLMQKNWIGKSFGARVNFKVGDLDLPVFTTRPDTLFGATFVVVAPDHDLIEKMALPEILAELKKYQEEVASMSEIDRTSDTKEKTGLFLGTYAINPVDGEKIPVYTSSYVLKSYGTGAIMAVPAHDQRDFDFAKKFDIEIKQVIDPYEKKPDLFGKYEELLAAVDGAGVMMNSGEFDGLDWQTGGAKVIDFLEQKKVGKREVCYRLRDWIFSRQRYWGEPIPLVHCEKCGVVPVPEDELPVKLPDVEKYQPTGTGESPLADIDWWVNVDCPSCGGKAKRETNTMPQWAGSCWYFLRYPNPNLSDKPFDKQDLDYWLPVDLYVGGIEHAILHLLYARFYGNFLHDVGYPQVGEPFKKLFNQGMICMYSEKSGRVEKMSKSKGNVVNPDDILKEFGADALRMYMLFIGPPELDCEWKMESIKGVKNFLSRLWDFLTNKENVVEDESKISEESRKRFHRFLKDYQGRIDAFKVNTAVASMMEFLNDLNSKKLKFDKTMLEQFLVSCSVVVPHFASELLEKLLSKDLKGCSWPAYDDSLAEQEEIELAIQVNGKLRGTLLVKRNISQEECQSMAEEKVKKWLEGRNVKKIVFVPNRLISFVVK